MSLNAAANGLTVEILNEDLTASTELAAGLILAGDVCYERGMAQAATRWLEAQAKLGATVLLADPGRAYRPQEGLIEVARYAVPTSRDLEESEERQAVIWRLAPRAG
jgi:predicted nicotinamide N-methyase